MARKQLKRSGKKSQDSEDNEKGSAEFNHSPVENKEVDVKMPEGKIKDLGKLFVGGLSHLTTEKELQAYFSRFGEVFDSVVRRFQNSGKSQGFGFVTFCNPEDAKAALKVEVHMLDGKLIEIRPFSSKPPSKKFETRVFLRGLPCVTSEETLRQFFSRYGKILRVVVPRDNITNQIKGYGYLVFSDNQAVEKCLNDKFVFIAGRRVRIEKVKVRDRHQDDSNDSLSSESVSSISEALEVLKDEVLCEKSIKTHTNSSESLNEKLEGRIFLGGLPHGITEKTLRQFFSRYGEVVEVVIPRDKISKKNKGFGFLAFSDRCAAEKCEADQFVFLEGRRIQIKKAEPRRQCKFSDSLSWKSGSESNIYEALEDEDEEAQSDISGNDLAIEQSPVLKAVFKNYFLEKLENFDSMNETMSKNENETRCRQDSQLAEIEKLLAGFLSISNHNLSASIPDFMKFPSESEDETDSSDDEVEDSFMSDLSKAPIPNCQENSFNQKPLPLQIRNSEGFLMCSVCQWISPNDSMESFLAHCKTSLHKTKLKERFPSGQIDNELEKFDSEPKLVPGRSSAHSTAKAKKKNNKIKNKKTKKEQQQSEKVALNKKNKEETNAVDKVKNEKQELSSNLKIWALAKGMASIQPFSKDELMCKLCNKKIPKALEFDVLMKNVSTHLHSKMHLKKLAETENSLMASHERTPTPTCNVKENQNQSNLNVQEKKEKKCQEGIHKSKAPDVGKSQNFPKVHNNPPRKKSAEKKQENNSDSDTKFLCLPCNVRCDSIEVFNVHVKLKSHLDNLANKNVKPDVSMANMGKCKGCKLYLCGSLYQINKHYSKCVEK